jgi:alkane 1-monooxygenase
MTFFLLEVSNDELPLTGAIGITSAYGMSCGILGINAAHELGHRNKKYEQLMSKLLLLTTLYMHFFIEHNRGHHKNVSTPADPASARKGEAVYAFYLRSILGSWISAWNIEMKKLKRSKSGFWSLKNEMLMYQFIQLILLAAITILFGFNTLLWFVIGAIIGILLLETVNYIEHYGLQRKKKGDSYERTLPVHSWNSNHPVGRLVLLELSRHSDHHYIASRKYQVLRHFDDSPQMPAGYPAMMLLSLIPPVWFSVMHKKLAQFKNTAAGKQLA